jgi:hypothetical protein
MGAIVYCGIDECKQEICELVKPKVCLNVFYYNCSNKFNIEIAAPYLESYEGCIVFANGDETFIYKYESGKFKCIKRIQGLLQKRQKKGGQSAQRIGRLAEETRHIYITRIKEHLPRDCKIFVFGSKEICESFSSTNAVTPKYMGYLDFNCDTILNTRYWCEFLKEKDSVIQYWYDKICEYLETDVDMLDFDPKNRDQMQYVMDKPYGKLENFEYIGVKYFKYEIECS